MTPADGGSSSRSSGGGSPGAELSAGRYLNLFARVPIEIPLSGTYFDEVQTGVPGSLQDFEEPVGDYSGGWTFLVGFQVRISLLGPPPDGARPASTLEGDGLEEPDL